MRLIAHRGNTCGVRHELENRPDYLDDALNMGFDIEIDVRVQNGKLFLGHDAPQYMVNAEWMASRKERLWAHCKDIQAMEMLQGLRSDGMDLNFFWHENDTMTLTSGGYIWVYPGMQPIKNSIAVLPEIGDDDISDCAGICSDWVNRYRERIEKADPL